MNGDPHLSDAGVCGLPTVQARVIYWPIYLAGITYLRTAMWFVGVLGLVEMGRAAL